MVIASNAVPAAITQVDACTGAKFTARAVFLADSQGKMLKVSAVQLSSPKRKGNAFIQGG
jgi:hypothetical protein